MAQYLEGSEQQKSRAYSPAVITEGGRTIWLAGQIAMVDGAGKDISGNFEAQTHRVFELMDQTLRRAGGTLANLVTMTVFIKESRHGDRFVELRKGSSRQRADHGHELRAPGYRARDPGDRRHRRPGLRHRTGRTPDQTRAWAIEAVTRAAADSS